MGISTAFIAKFRETFQTQREISESVYVKGRKDIAVTISNYHFKELYLPNIDGLRLSIDDNQFIFDSDSLMAVASLDYLIKSEGERERRGKIDISMKNVILSWAVEIVYDPNSYSKLKGDSNSYFIFDAERNLETMGDNDQFDQIAVVQLLTSKTVRV
jgi:hypothetical protein